VVQLVSFGHVLWKCVVMIVLLSLTVTQVVYPSLAIHNSLATILVSNTVQQRSCDLFHVMLAGEPAKMNYDSGISSGPPGGMFSGSKLCCALYRMLHK